MRIKNIGIFIIVGLNAGIWDSHLYAVNLNGSLKWKFRIRNYWRIPKYLNPIDR